MFGIGGWELILIFAVVLLLFGAKRLPEIAKSMGKAVNEFKKGKDEFINSCEESNPPETSKER
jgi:sec-independent protein translocase protein TatA